LLRLAGNSTPPARSLIYGLPLIDQGIRDVRFGLRVMF
jgi:hypothetical protein